MLRLITLAAIILIAQSISGHTAEAAGDPVRGEDLARQCFACHGKDGNSPSPINPKIGGQHERYLVLAMNEYRDGKRKESLMRGAVLQLSKDEIEDIAAYYARQRAFTETPAKGGRQGGSAQGAGPGGPQGGPQGGPGSLGGMRVDKVERQAYYLSLLTSAVEYERAKRSIASVACLGLTGPANGRDADNDNLDDAFDAAPDNPDEFTKDGNGDGSYEICSIEQLQAIVTLGEGGGKSTSLSLDQRLGRDYQLGADLDASTIANFMPIGSCGPEDNCMIARGKYGYAGTFDGRNRTIKNLVIDRPTRGGVGLIGVLGESGKILNLNIANAKVKGRSGTGIAVGANMGTVYQVNADGEVDAGLAVGGLVGGNSGLVADSSVKGKVTAQQAAGGLVGDMTGAVFNSVAAVDVSGTRGLGGLVGLSTFGTIINSQASGTVTGASDLGGLVGMNTDANVSTSFSASVVTGEANNVGGLVGFNSLSLVRNSYATGAVKGGDSVGALVGRNNGIIRRSYALGGVTAETNGGGLVGQTVQGEDKDSFTDPSKLTVGTTGWTPDRMPVQDFLDYFCDLNRNGYIDPDEQVRTNFVWEFNRGAPPVLRCNAAKS